MISKEDVNRIASLSRLSLSNAQSTLIQEHLSRILDHISKLNEINTDGIEPTYHVIAIQNVIREDKVEPSLSLEDALGNAPDKTDAHYRVPKIID